MTTIHAPGLRAGSSARLRTRVLAVFPALHGVAHFAGSTSGLASIEQAVAAPRAILADQSPLNATASGDRR